MTTVYCARWILPISAPPIADGAIAIDDSEIVFVGRRSDLSDRFAEGPAHHLGDAVILPGLVNTHSHLELTAMRGFLDAEESDFLLWLKKLTVARLELMTLDDLYVSAAWGACEAARAGITCLGDASAAAAQSMKALCDVGLRGTVYQESFGPDPHLAAENFEILRDQVGRLREKETTIVRAGVSPHAPYTVCAPQLEMIAQFATAQKLPLMMHAAESVSEDLLMREGRGPFAERLASRGIQWQAPGTSTVQYLANHGVLGTSPLLAHCIHVDEEDIETIKQTGASVAHCPKSNAKLGHGRAPFGKFLEGGVKLGFGSDSVASNNTCDMLEEARFATLFARAEVCGGSTTSESTGRHSGTGRRIPDAHDALRTATSGGASAMGLARRVGALSVGLDADFIAVSLNGVQQVPAYDAASALVFASSGRDVVLTVVAGQEVYRDGRVLAIDEERLRARMSEIAKKLGIGS